MKEKTGIVTLITQKINDERPRIAKCQDDANLQAKDQQRDIPMLPVVLPKKTRELV